ncbi:YcgN family cysteine cluster protein [Primorskyibacter aestuariivivens]|uniref:YcgN family cysteine cluster protein n=1 Tax=Primorskyibacter aestuariivivens TaxID=1888912 RepID=UPI0023001392|nr:YcgN family cysteine cluster protein [Primorskyibacter aestuariivivens]MDA7427293.1 YcgN family cysteine cluster protein [Primorskyibacter aestuariivivens]
MSDPINRSGLAARFWEHKPLTKLSPREWEALCDGCGKCCLNKLEDEETGEVALTRVACRLFDDMTCRCAQYEIRHQFVPECIQLTPDTIEQHAYWLPETCAYKLLWDGRPLYDWHPLISGTPETVHEAGISMQSRTVPEFEVHEDDWEDHIIEEPM